MKVKAILHNSFLVFASTLAPLLGVSLFLELLTLPSWTRKSEIESIEQKREVSVDYPAKIRSAVNGFVPLYYPEQTRKHFLGSRHYPVGTLPHTQTFYCNEGYGLISYKSDRFGLRNNDDDWDKIRSRSTTFFVGDSFTQGACVEKEFVFTELISKSLTANVLNLGTGSNGPYEYIALLRNVVKPIISSPHSAKSFSTILVFYDNDNIEFNETLENHLNASHPIADIDSNGFINVSNKYVSTLNQIIATHYPTKTQDIVEKLELRATQALKPVFNGSFTHRVLSLYSLRLRFKELINTKHAPLRSPSIQAIKELNAICNSETLCTPYVVFIPNSNYWRPNDKSDEYKLLLEETSKGLSIEFLDSSSVINPNEKSNYAPIGLHLSRAGNRKLASFIASKIDQN